MRLPFGCKYSLVLCQRVLEYFMLQARLQGPHTGVIILHYSDDFMVVGGNKEKVRQVTAHWVEALTEAVFLVSPKSKLEPDSIEVVR